MASLEKYFNQFRKNIVGIDQEFETPYGTHENQSMAIGLPVADCIALSSVKLRMKLGPYVGNTHTETSETGLRMTHAYHKSHQLIKQHVNAGPDDIIITAGFGMTACNQ